MTTMVAELYDALIAAGSPQDKARAAAAAMAEYDPYQQRFVKIEADISSIRTEITEMKGDISALAADVIALKLDVAVLKTDVAGLKGDIATLIRRVAALEGDNLLMKWMLGFVLAFQIAIFVKLFLH
jgi:peptidoglycan hydrolase CwlO-like protein